MARNRMLNPDFWIDEELGTISAHARLLYMGLWGICDDNYATLPDRPEWIKLQILPYDSVNTRELLSELERIGKIIKFTHEDKPFWYIKNFHKHQKVDHPSRSKYPKSPMSRRVLTEPSDSPRHELTNKVINKEDIPLNPEGLKKVGDFVRGKLPPSRKKI